MNVFNSIKKMNRLRKELNRLLSKRMSNITIDLLKTSILKILKICPRVSF